MLCAPRPRRVPVVRRPSWLLLLVVVACVLSLPPSSSSLHASHERVRQQLRPWRASRLLYASAAASSRVWSLHGAGYEHLDCSACLTVAGMLSGRMNDSLTRLPRTYLAVQRLATGSVRERRSYRGSELRAVEILEDLCSDANYKYYRLRVNSRSKVRGYHLLYEDNASTASRQALRETDAYPPPSADNATSSSSSSSPSWRAPLAMLPVALLYNAHERLTLAPVQSRAAAIVCEHLLADYEDEVIALLRTATLRSEVEAQLCGLAASTTCSSDGTCYSSSSSNNSTTDDDAHAVVLPVCRDVAALRRATARDQRRWLAYVHIQDKRRRTTTATNTTNTTNTTITQNVSEASSDHVTSVDNVSSSSNSSSGGGERNSDL